MENTGLAAIKLNSTCDLDLLPLQGRYRIISGNPTGKGLVWVGSPKLMKVFPFLSQTALSEQTNSNTVISQRLPTFTPIEVAWSM
jgi:hypothetical protein